jgi:uncharacterized OB-fold protein
MTALTEPFWSAARERRLAIQRCDDCETFRFPPEPACATCSSTATSWVEMSGRATLYTWTVTHAPLLPFFAEREPWPVAVVELEEGPRLVTNLIDVSAEDYAIGMPLQVAFEDASDDVTLIVFRRQDGTPDAARS